MEFLEFKKSYEKTWKISTSDNPNIDFCKNHDFSFEIKTNKELSDSALYSIWWFVNNGFSSVLKTNNTAKTEFVVSKEGTEDIFILTATNQNPKRCDIKSYMDCFNKSFKMKQEIEKLKKLKESK